MQEIRNAEKGKYRSFERSQFPNRCIVCNKNLLFGSDFFLLPLEDALPSKLITNQKQTYYTCECIDQNYAWLTYQYGPIRTLSDPKNSESDAHVDLVVNIDIGYSLVDNSLLSDFDHNQSITDENKLYHHHHQTSELTYFRVPVDDILFTRHIKKVATNAKGAKNIEMKCEKLIDLGNSLSLFSLMNFHNPYGLFSGRSIYGNLEAWLGFDVEIKDLFIFSGAPFWQRIKKSLLIESIVTCISFVERFGSSISSDEIENLEVARNRFIAHFDLDADDDETKGYVEILYSTFNKLVKDFNKKHNKPPYNLHISFEELYLSLPRPHTSCDNAFRNILSLINFCYKQQNQDLT